MGKRPGDSGQSASAPRGNGILKTLRNTSLFSSCSEEDLEVIASLSGEAAAEDGDAIFRAGDASSRFFIVCGGEISIRRDDGEGRSAEIARFLPGDFFGELDFFTGRERTADAVADGRVSLLAFPGGEGGLEGLSESHPGVNARLLHAFLVQISARIRGVNALVKENSPIVRELRRQVYADKLTGLNNKTYFEETLKKVISESGGPVGLLMYKPDNFKLINDTHGHEAGDRTLRYIAEGLKSFVPDRDMLFRYMGNENAIIVPGADRGRLKRMAEDTGEFLRGLDLAALLDGDGIRLSVSFGLAVAPEHGGDAESLVEAAHVLTLEGRRRGGNLVLFPEDSEDAHDP